MNLFSMPRAARPVNARVNPVRRDPASAARCTADVPASGQRRNAVPNWAAMAPADSTAARPAPVEIPPAATRGRSTCSVRSASNASSP